MAMGVARAGQDALRVGERMPDLTGQEMAQLADDYAKDFGLGDPAHPCDIKSSIDPSGRVRSNYVPAPVLIA